MRPARLLILFVALAGGSLALGLLAGSVPISIGELWSTLFGEPTGPAHDIIFTVRLLRDLSAVTSSGWAWLILVGLALLATLYSNALNVLSLGRNKAAALGVPVLKSEIAIYVGACAATVSSVALAGTIGFVGLIVPHSLR